MALSDVNKVPMVLKNKMADVMKKLGDSGESQGQVARKKLEDNNSLGEANRLEAGML
jgi:hypothetical protein